MNRSGTGGDTEEMAEGVPEEILEKGPAPHVQEGSWGAGERFQKRRNLGVKPERIRSKPRRTKGYLVVTEAEDIQRSNYLLYTNSLDVIYSALLECQEVGGVN